MESLQEAKHSGKKESSSPTSAIAQPQASPLTAESPLFVAARFDKIEEGVLLLTKGADFTAVETLATSKRAYRTLHNLAKIKKRYDEQCTQASRTKSDIKSLPDISFIRQRGAAIVAYPKSPLDIAVEKSELETVTTLLQTAPGRAMVKQTDKYGSSPLWAAACKGDHEIVRALLKTKEGREMIGYLSIFLSTPLCIATKHGHVEVVEAFLETVEGRSAINEVGEGSLHRTPLCTAVEHGHIGVVSKFLQTLEGRRALIDHADHERDETPLYIASKNDRVDMVKLILSTKEGLATVNQLCPDHLSSLSLSPLARAAKEGHLEVVMAFLETKEGLEVINLTETLSETPLYLAARTAQLRHLEIGVLLLSKGASISAAEKSAKDKIMATEELIRQKEDLYSRALSEEAASHMFHYENAEIEAQKAILENLAQIQKIYQQRLLSKPDAKHQKSHGFSEALFSSAASKLSFPQVPDEPANSDNESDESEEPEESENLAKQLLAAAKKGDLQTVRVLLKQINNPDSNPLWLAVHPVKKLEIVEALLAVEEGRALIKSKDELGRSPLWHAIHLARLELAKAILATEEGRLMIQQEDSDGDTVLQMAVLWGHISIVNELLQLTEGRAVVDRRNHKGETALDFAVSHGHLQIVKALLSTKKGLATINHADNLGISPLTLAAERGGYFPSEDDVAIGVMLLMKGADFAATEKFVESQKDEGDSRYLNQVLSNLQKIKKRYEETLAKTKQDAKTAEPIDVSDSVTTLSSPEATLSPVTPSAPEEKKATSLVQELSAHIKRGNIAALRAALPQDPEQQPAIVQEYLKKHALQEALQTDADIAKKKAAVVMLVGQGASVIQSNEGEESALEIVHRQVLAKQTHPALLMQLQQAAIIELEKQDDQAIAAMEKSLRTSAPAEQKEKVRSDASDQDNIALQCIQQLKQNKQRLAKLRQSAQAVGQNPPSSAPSSLTLAQKQQINWFREVLKLALSNKFIQSIAIAKGLAAANLDKVGAAITGINTGASFSPVPFVAVGVKAITFFGERIYRKYDAKKQATHCMGLATLEQAALLVDLLEKEMICRYQYAIAKLAPESLEVFAHSLVHRIFGYVEHLEQPDAAPNFMGEKLVDLTQPQSKSAAAGPIISRFDSQIATHMAVNLAMGTSLLPKSTLAKLHLSDASCQVAYSTQHGETEYTTVEKICLDSPVITFTGYNRSGEPQYSHCTRSSKPDAKYPPELGVLYVSPDEVDLRKFTIASPAPGLHIPPSVAMPLDAGLSAENERLKIALAHKDAELAKRDAELAKLKPLVDKSPKLIADAKHSASPSPFFSKIPGPAAPSSQRSPLTDATDYAGFFASSSASSSAPLMPASTSDPRTLAQSPDVPR